MRAVLPRAARVTVPRSRDGAADLVVNGAPLQIKWAGEGQLRDIKEFLERRSPRPGIVAARRMSLAARAALSDAGIGWMDETGAAEISHGSIVISRTGAPSPKVARPARWTASVLAAAEALLCGTAATVAAIQQATGLSTGSCTAALRALSDLGLLKAEAARGRASARHVVDPRRLLDEYAAAAPAARPNLSLQVGAVWRDVLTGITELGRRWEGAKVPWALTGAAASLVIAPLLTNVSAAEIYVDAATLPQLQVIAGIADLRPMEGGRLILRPFPTASSQRLSRREGALRIAPWPRVYADLLPAGVRGEEAAEHLREVVNAR
jgi:hypothetical protein